MENIRAGVVDYDRQVAMTSGLMYRPTSAVLHQPTLFFIGCGGIGFWAAMYAAMLGYQKFVLYDADSVDQTNLNRLPLNQAWLGKPKVLALKALMRSMRPDIVVKCFKRNFNPDVDSEFIGSTNRLNYYNTGTKSIFLFDCTDNVVVQKKIYEMHKKLKYTSYYKMGYEGYDIGVYAKYDNVWTQDNYETGYRTAASNCISSSICAGFGLIKAMAGFKEDFNMNIYELAKGGNNETLAK